MLSLKNEQAAMVNTKGMRFPIYVILVCICWYAAYRLSYRHFYLSRIHSRPFSGFEKYMTLTST